MIIVRGSVKSDKKGIEEMLRISLEHVARSRLEPGCLSHSVSIDAEDCLRLNFFEEWEDLKSLHQHFAVAESIAFVQRLQSLAVAAPELRIFDASQLR